MIVYCLTDNLSANKFLYLVTKYVISLYQELFFDEIFRFTYKSLVNACMTEVNIK